MDKSKIYEGVVVIIRRIADSKTEYLIIENKTGNITFLAGAKELVDLDLQATAHREIKEELGLESNQYMLKQTGLNYEFIFGAQKKERAGALGRYTIFTAEVGKSLNIKPTSEIKSVKWFDYNGVLSNLTFDDLKSIFIQLFRLD